MDAANAVLRPIGNLATRGVNGGNVMKLRGKDAQFLYGSSGILYLDISGTSKGSPKSAFSDALPPSPVAYIFLGEGVDASRIKRSIANVRDQQIDYENWLYIIRQPLPDVGNGGEIVAVFSADQLRGLVWRTIKIVAMVSVAVLLVTILVAVMLGRWISRPVIITSNQIKEISETLDLSKRVEISSKSEIGETATAFNGLLDKMQEILGEVDGSTTHLKQATDRLSASTAISSQRIHDQEMQTEQVVVAMTEMSAVVNNVASNAAQAASAAKQANKEAGAGLVVVNQTVGAIDDLASNIESVHSVIQRLGEESENIGGVLDVIRGIAEQTNLLALNAAIEAARAGESGRGFAVVADEVRSLASRTQQSTQEIQAMIERLQSGAREARKTIEGGRSQARTSVEQASGAGESLRSIASTVGIITQMNTEIESNVKEQAIAVEGINQSVARINEITENTTQDVKGAASGSEQLAALADNLTGLIGQFKI